MSLHWGSLARETNNKQMRKIVIRSRRKIGLMLRWRTGGEHEGPYEEVTFELRPKGRRRLTSKTPTLCPGCAFCLECPSLCFSVPNSHGVPVPVRQVPPLWVGGGLGSFPSWTGNLCCPVFSFLPVSRVDLEFGKLPLESAALPICQLLRWDLSWSRRHNYLQGSRWGPEKLRDLPKDTQPSSV